MNRITLLKIKIKSLADEQRTIRHEENKCRSQERWAKGKHLPRAEGQRAAHAYTSDHVAVREVARELRLAMRQHRKGDLRPMIRAAQLAYGFLRGMPYYQIEATCKDAPDLNAILANANRFSNGSKQYTASEIEEWLLTRPLAEVQKAA